MGMVAKVVAAMERVLGKGVNALAKEHQVIRRERKFTGESGRTTHFVNLFRQ